MSSPPAYADGTVPTQEDLAYWYTRPSCIALMSSTVSLTSGSHVLVTWNGANGRQTGDTTHSSSSNTSRIVLNTLGWHKVRILLVYSANTSGIRWLNVRKNSAGSYTGGSDVTWSSIPAYGASGSSTTVGTTGYVECTTPGDYVECFAYQDSGSTLTLTTGTSFFAVFYHAAP